MGDLSWLFVEDQALRSSLEAVWDSYQSARASGAAPFDAAVRVAVFGRPARARVCSWIFGGARALDPRSDSAVRALRDRGRWRIIRARSRPRWKTLDAGSGYTLNGCEDLRHVWQHGEDSDRCSPLGRSSADGKPKLAVVRIPADREGVSLRELPPIPFVPEIPHAARRVSRCRRWRPASACTVTAISTT